MNKLIKFGFVALVLVLSFASCSQSTAQSTDVDQKAVKSTSLSMNIEGMTCAMGCARALEVELNNLDGVEKAKVNFEDSNAKLVYNASLTSETAIIAFVNSYRKGAFTATPQASKKSCCSSSKKSCSAEKKAKCEDSKEKCQKSADKSCCASKKVEKKSCASDCIKSCCA